MCGKHVVPCAAPGQRQQKEEGIQAALLLSWTQIDLVNGDSGSEGQRNTGTVLVSVTVVIYWVNFFLKHTFVWVGREAEQTSTGRRDQERRRTG